MDRHEKLNAWKVKRRTTTIIAMIHTSLFGMEYTSISISLLFYLNNILHAKHPSLFYGLAYGAMNTSSVISSIFLGKYMDKLRNARFILLSTGVLAIVGNLLYSLPYSPWLLVIGRFLCGFADAAFPVMTGEFTRCYNKDDLGKVIYKYQTLLMCCFMIGPCIPVLLQGIHYEHWPIILDQSNCIGILLMCLQLICSIVVFFGFSNLSEEPGYELFLEELSQEEEDSKSFIASYEVENKKEEVRKSQRENTGDEGIAGDVTKLPLKNKILPLTIKDIFSNFDVSLVIFSTSFVNFHLCLIDLIINILCINTLKWTLNEISIATIAGLVFNLVVSLGPYKFFKETNNIFYLHCISVLIPWCMLCMLLFLYAGFIVKYVYQMLMVITLVMLNLFSSGLSASSGRLLLFHLIPSHSSSYCDGIRNSSSRIFGGIAFYIAAEIYSSMTIPFVVFIILLFILILCLFNRRLVFLDGR